MERTKRNDFSTFGAADHFTFDDALADRNTCMGTHEHDITRRIPQHWQPGHRATYANERLPRHSGQDVDGEPACQVVASNSLGSPVQPWSSTALRTATGAARVRTEGFSFISSSWTNAVRKLRTMSTTNISICSPHKPVVVSSLQAEAKQLGLPHVDAQ